MRATTSLVVSSMVLSGLTVSIDRTQLPGHIPDVKGFKNSTIQHSAGGHAICISGTIDVTTSAEVVHVKLSQPKNQTDLTNIVLELTQINATLEERILGDSHQINDTYGIYSQLCFPTTSLVTDRTSKPKPLQVLVHGGGFDRQYWNNAPKYSYVDYAAEQGYPTFLYDRLGVGQSDHPDPLQVVQTSTHVAIAHKLVQLLRTPGKILATGAFTQIVAVGHSYGSAQILGDAVQNPKDFDAIVLTGAAADPNGMNYNTVGQVQTIASQNAPDRFAHLPNGYVLPGYIEGLQYGFFRAPQFDPRLLELAESTKQPQGLGEMLVFGDIKPAANFTGPVYVVNGENDLPICLGNCYFPFNKAAAAKDMLFSASSTSGSTWYIVPGTGHGVNYHYGAEDAYAHIHGFLKRNGL